MAFILPLNSADPGNPCCTSQYVYGRRGPRVEYRDEPRDPRSVRSRYGTEQRHRDPAGSLGFEVVNHLFHEPGLTITAPANHHTVGT